MPGMMPMRSRPWTTLSVICVVAAAGILTLTIRSFIAPESIATPFHEWEYGLVSSSGGIGIQWSQTLDDSFKQGLDGRITYTRYQQWPTATTPMSLRHFDYIKDKRYSWFYFNHDPGPPRKLPPWIPGSRSEDRLRFTKWTLIMIPDWFVLLIVLGAGWFAWKRRQRPAPGYCGRCGYDLRATPERCPECGMEQQTTATV